MVNEVLPSHEACVEAALEAAKAISLKPPVAIWGTKQVLHYVRDHSVEDGLRHMGWLQGAIWSNANVREAITAMKEKRDPVFPDLPPLKGFRSHGL
jgi:enoyl-CoA hydratase